MDSSEALRSTTPTGGGGPSPDPYTLQSPHHPQRMSEFPPIHAEFGADQNLPSTTMCSPPGTCILNSPLGSLERASSSPRDWGSFQDPPQQSSPDRPESAQRNILLHQNLDLTPVKPSSLFSLLSSLPHFQVQRKWFSAASLRRAAFYAYITQEDPPSSPPLTTECPALSPHVCPLPTAAPWMPPSCLQLRGN